MELKFQYLLWSVALGIKSKAFDMLGKCPITEPHPGTLISWRNHELGFHLADRRPLLGSTVPFRTLAAFYFPGMSPARRKC